MIKIKKKRKTVEEVVPVRIKDHRDNKGGHPHIILGDIGDNHVSVGLSTKPRKGKNHPNYPLKRSPLGDGKTSYMRKQGIVDKKSSYTKPRMGNMAKDDYGVARKYGERAVEKFKKGEKK